MNTKVEECSFEEIEKVLAEKPELLENIDWAIAWKCTCRKNLDGYEAVYQSERLKGTVDPNMTKDEFLESFAATISCLGCGDFDSIEELVEEETRIGYCKLWDKIISKIGGTIDKCDFGKFKKGDIPQLSEDAKALLRVKRPDLFESV